MKPTFSTRDQAEIEAAALREFDCSVLPFGSKREDKARARKRASVAATTRKFIDAANSSKPPATRDEAIGASVGLVATILSLIFPQFALAISVAGWLWDYLNGEL
jgi:hypothetical protein